MPFRFRSARRGLLLAACLLAGGCASLPPPAASTSRQVPASAAGREARMTALLQADRTRPAFLRALLQAMPKGGDLHNHLSGSVYAEDFIRWAGEEGYCVRLEDHGLHAPPCGDGQVPARDLATRDAALYARVVDALSMRNFLPGQPQVSGHDRFFSTFGKFGVVDACRADTVVATLEQAARDRVGYVEIIANPPQSDALGRRMQALGWQPGDYAADLARLQAELPAMVAAARQGYADTDTEVQQRMRCGQAGASPGCAVEYRYVAYALRVLPPPMVFGQMALGYALVDAGGSRFVGVNIVAPEDHPVALADYRQHMDMFRALSQRYPGVKLSLHAGELALGLVPPAELRFHIAEAVDAGAARIGHGVDLAYEADPAALLRRMRERQVAVEVNLTSNDVILGVQGGEHPLAMYLAAGVPVVLSTDDAGVSRVDLTHEYQRAVQEQGLDYPTLKRIVRNGLSYSFLRGESLWAADGRAVPACAAALAREAAPDAGCQAWLAGSEKGRLQWRLEDQLAAFERAALEPAR